MSIFIIDSESLIDPLWLNTLSQLHVEIEYEPSSDASKYHNVFFIKYQDERNLIPQLQKKMKRGWYSFCFKPETITIVFTDKTFTYFKNGIETNSYAGAVAHGASKKIKKEFLYFN